MDEIAIDGSMGEGGGQILRSSLALSLVSGRPVRIENIRAGRAKPGLLRQHLTAAKAAEAIGARVEGAELGASTLRVTPRRVLGGDYHFKIASAGSACLVLQTVLPAFIAAREKARLTLEGGTHNPFAPSFDYVERVFAPVLGRMGVEMHFELERRGFYPAGGGRFTVEIDARQGVTPIEILERGEVIERRATAIVANLPGDIARREIEVVEKKLGWAGDELSIVQDSSSPGPGNIVMLEVGDGTVRELCSGFGEKRVRAERVAALAAGELSQYLAGTAPVGRRLADQLMLPFAIAGAGVFRTLELTQHSRANLAVIEAFAPGCARVLEDGREALIEFGPGLA